MKFEVDKVFDTAERVEKLLRDARAAGRRAAQAQADAAPPTDEDADVTTM